MKFLTFQVSSSVFFWEECEALPIEKTTLQMSNVILFSCYLLKFQNVCIDGIIPNTFLLDNPSNIIWPNNLLAKMQNGCWFVIIETILETWSHFSWHDKH